MQTAEAKKQTTKTNYFETVLAQLNEQFPPKNSYEREERQILYEARKKAFEEGKNPETLFIVCKEVSNIAPLLRVIKDRKTEDIVSLLDTAVWEIVNLIGNSDDSQIDCGQHRVLVFLKELRDAFILTSDTFPVLNIYDTR